MPKGSCRELCQCSPLATRHTGRHAIHRAPAGPLFKKEGMLLRPVAQLYGLEPVLCNRLLIEPSG